MPSSTKPPGPCTGYAHPKCYAKGLNDCSAEITREHYVSKSLLVKFGDNFMVNGFPWIAPGEARKLTDTAMRSWILCKRHNNALSPLDSMVEGLWDALKVTQQLSSIGVASFDGHDLERWAIKVLLGMMVSGNVRAPDGTRGRLPIDNVPIEYVRILFSEEDLIPERGFWYTGKYPEGARADGIGVWLRSLLNADGSIGDVYAVDVNILGLHWTTTIMAPLDTTNIPRWYRPRGFRLPIQGVIELQWQTPGADVLEVMLMSPMNVINFNVKR